MEFSGEKGTPVHKCTRASLKGSVGPPRPRPNIRSLHTGVPRLQENAPPLGRPEGPRHRPTVGSYGEASSCNRGTPVNDLCSRSRRARRQEVLTIRRRRWSSNPSGKCSYERPTRGTVSGTMRSMCGADAGCLAINYQSLLTGPCDPKGSMVFPQNHFLCPPMLGARRTYRT